MKVNKNIGKYKIKDSIPIFDSKNSTIYLAESDEIGATSYQYALKIYKQKESGLRECEIANQIKNSTEFSIVVSEPIVCRTEGEILYSVSRYQNDGMFLSDLLKKKIPLNKQVDLLFKLLTAVKHLHCDVVIDENSKGYIHTDLHPGNIFVESVSGSGNNLEFGEVKFIDFSNSLPIIKKEKKAARDPKVRVGGAWGYFPYDLIDESRQYIFPSVDLYAISAIGTRMFLNIEVSERWDYALNLKWNKKNKHTVVEYLIFRFLKCGLEYDPMYRYQDAEQMLKSLSQIKSIIEKKDLYYELFEESYKMAVPIEECTFDDLELNVRSFIQAKDKLESALTSNYINKHKCNYIFEAMWKLRSYFEVNKRKIPKEEICKLISCGISSNNHLANTQRVFELIEELNANEKYIAPITLSNINNRVSNAYCDFYEYEMAHNIIENNIKILEHINKMANPDYRSTALGRAYSALGCYKVFTGKYDKKVVMDCFEKAIYEFDDGENEFNKGITYSHILHYSCVDKKHYDIYEKYIDLYLGCKNEKEDIYEKRKARRNTFIKLNKAEDKKRSKKNREVCALINKNPFVILAYLKGIYTFELNSDEEINMVESHKEFMSCLKDILYAKVLDEPEHPIQLVYKYIGLILKRCNQQQYSKEIIEAEKKSLTILESGRINKNKLLNITMLISYQTLWEYNEFYGKEDDNKVLFEQLQKQKGIAGWESLMRELEKRKQSGIGLKGLLSYEII